MIVFCRSKFHLGAILSAFLVGPVILPSATAAKSIDLQDLIESQRPETEALRLREQKLDQFRDPELFKLLRDITIALFENDFVIAENRARALSVKAPLSPQGWHLLGLALANQGRVDEAIKALDQAAGIYEVNADPLVIKGDLLLAQGDKHAARDAFEAAAARDPDDWRAQDSLATMALEEGDAGEALTRSERAAIAISFPVGCQLTELTPTPIGSEARRANVLAS